MNAPAHGPHRLERRIHRGARFDVFLARSGTHGLAVEKRLHESLHADPEATGRFARAIRISAGLEHPGIERVLRWDWSLTPRWIVTEYVPGWSLEVLLAHLRGAPMPPAVAIWISRRIAEALRYAHELDRQGAKAVIHGDLNPSNVLLGADGSVKLIGFGHRVARRDPLETTAFECEFLSPEQAMGKPSDARTDIHSLGLILFELLTGVRLLRRQTAHATLRAAMAGVPDRVVIRDAPEAVGVRLTEAIVRALQREPARRQQCVAELCAELDFIGEETPWKADGADLARFLQLQTGVGRPGLPSTGAEHQPHPAAAPRPRDAGRTVTPEPDDDCIRCGALVAADRCETCGAAQAAGPWRIEELLAERPGSRVYRAFDARGREAALKELSFLLVPGIAEIDAFQREGTLLEQLSHPGIARCYGSFQVDLGLQLRLYLAQEFIVGRTLADVIHQRGKLESLASYELAIRLLEVLAFLHGQPTPVVHRDIKPANIILRESGELTLVDLGSARQLERGHTHGSTLVGTFGYMAPEQLGGTVTTASDIYAVGTTLFHALSGRSPAEHSDGRPSLSNWAQHVPSQWRTLLERFLAPRARDRPDAPGALQLLQRWRTSPLGRGFWI